VETLIYPTFSVELHKNANFKTLFVISSKSAFSVSIVSVHKARSNNIRWLFVSHWGPKFWKDQFQFTERSLAACKICCHRQHYFHSNSKNVRTSGRDNFKMQDLKLAFCNLEYSRIIACHPHLNCTQLLKGHSQSGL